MSDGSILPVVRYADPAEAAGWLCSAFGFSIHHVAKRPDGGTAYIVLRFGENSVVVASHGSSAFDDLMVQPADVGNRSTQTCYLTVQDVDQHCARALEAGARVEVEPSDDGIGGRFYMCRDPEGHLWSFGAPLVGLTPAGPDGPPSEQSRRHPALSSRAAIGLAVTVGVAVGCGTMFYLGTDLASNAPTASIGGMREPNALSSQLEQGASASAAKRLLVSEAALLGLAEKLQNSQLEPAEAQQLKRNTSKLLSASEAEYLGRLKDSQGALDAAVRAKELASLELEMERRRAQAIQRQLDETSQQLARLRADGSTFDVQARRPRDASGQTGAASPGATQAGETERGQLATAQNTEELLRERLRASERESKELQLRARMAILEMDKEAARAVREAESARTALAATQAKQFEPRDKLRTGEPGTADAPARVTAKEAARDVARMLPEHATEVARTSPPDAKVDEVTPRATPRAAYVRPLPQHQRAQRKKWISVAAIKKAKAERQRQVAEAAAAAARKAEEERQRLAVEAAQKAEAERQRQAAEAAAAAARKAEEERQRLAAEAAQKAEVERQRQAAEAAAAAARKAEEERQRLAVEAAQKAEVERQRQVAEAAAAAARKAEEERQRLAAEAAQKAEAERQRQAAEAAAARKAEEERQRLAAEAAQKAEAERQRQAAEAAAARKAEEERQRLTTEAAQKAEAERQRQVAEAAAAAARKAEEERQRVAAEAAQKAEAERQRQAAEAAAARKAEEERQRLTAEAAQKAEAERQRQVAEAAAAAARKAEEERQRLAAEATQKAGAERQRQVAEAAAAARKVEDERQRLAAEAAQKAEAERQHQVAEAAAAARKIEEERQRLAAEAAQKAEAERQRQVAEAAAAARKIEEERQRVAAEQKVEAERIAKEAVEAKARADQETRRRTLGLTVTSEDGTRFLARGRALLKTGDVASARLLLERASNAGLADAAMELAETYDPATVARLSAVGLVGDREQARVWYMRAQALGSSAAAERLKSIVGQ